MDCLQLVGYDKTFFDRSKEWLLDEELNHLIHAGTIPSDEERLAWFNSLSSRKDYLIWGVAYNGEPIGVSGLKRIADGKAEYWGYIGEKAYWGKGLGKDLMKEVLEKARELDLNYVWLRVRKYNPRAINLYKRIGFTIEQDEPETYLMSLSLPHNNEITN